LRFPQRILWDATPCSPLKVIRHFEGSSETSVDNGLHGAISQKMVVSLVSLGGVRLNPLGTSATVVLLYQPRMIDDDDYGAVCGMRIGRGIRSTRRKPAPVPLCPPQIPHDLTWDRTRAAAVGSQRVTPRRWYSS
jgi:hypothetical protein